MTAKERQNRLIKVQRRPSDREIDKLQAIRHLLHASIRMLFWEEDPFALHIVSQSCDKLITDCIKQDNLHTTVEFARFVKPQYLRDFYDIYRTTYNYFKHANKDRYQKLEVRDIVIVNETEMLVNAARLNEVYRIYTCHMKYFSHYMQMVVPTDWLKQQSFLEMARARFNIGEHTRGEIMENMRIIISADQSFLSERNEDLTDIEALKTVTAEEYYDRPRSTSQHGREP
jgi:hypothetical protein